MTSKLKLSLLSGVAAAATFMAMGQAQATNGMLPHCVGTVKCGMGGAGSAKAGAAVDASINPALAGKMGNTYQVNLGAFWADVTGNTSTRAGSNPGKQTSGADFFPNGSLGVNYVMTDKVNVNLSIVPGGGGASDWPYARSDNFFVGANQDQTVEYEMLYLQPSVSYKATNTATYGVGAILSRATMKTDSPRANFRPSGVEDTKETFYGVGFQVGGVWQLTDKGSAALNLRSPVWHQDTGVYDGVVFTDPIDTPMQAQLGLAFDATPSTMLAVDFKYVNWSGVSTIGNDPYTPQSQSAGFGWDDQQIIMLGVEHKLNDTTNLRAGFNHGNSPIDEEYVLANFLFPAIVENHFTAGGDYDLGGGMKIGVSAYYAPENSLTDNGGANANGNGAVLSHSQHGFQLSFSNEF